jgi:MFS family permease
LRWGWLIDRFSPQRLVGAGNLVSAAAFVTYLFVGSTWQLVAAAFVASVGQATFWTATRALIGAITESSERANWFALQQRARNAGYGIGGLLGAVAVSTGSRWLPGACGRQRR